MKRKFDKDLKGDLGQVPGPIGATNRAYDTAATEPLVTVDLEMINDIIVKHMTDVIIPTVDDNGNSHAVPILYGTPERWETIRKAGALRDNTNQKLLTPLIVLRRTSVKQGALLNPNNKYMYRTVSTEWNPRNSYDKFAVQNSINPSVHIRNIMIPDYMDLTYEVMMWTEYQEQMDQLIEQINVEAYEFWGNRNQFKFRVKIDEYQGESKLPTSEDRIIRTQFNMVIAAYLLPERVVRNFKLGSTNTEQYSPKKVIFNQEAVDTLKNRHR